MQIKNIIIGILVFVVLGAGYYYYTNMNSTENTVPYTNNQAQNAKINVEEVCRGALAYMTFTSGAEAEVFVQECIEGKHPEVIEQYRASLNLNTGAEI